MDILWTHPLCIKIIADDDDDVPTSEEVFSFGRGGGAYFKLE